MPRTFSSLAVAALTLVACSTLLAQHGKSQLPAPAPIPAQITGATKVFIANGGGDRLETLGETELDGGPDRPYNEFYAAMKSWGHYQLVSSPSDADLVLKISCTLNTLHVELPFPIVGQLHLVVADPRSHVALWEMREYVRGAGGLGNRDKNFDVAMNTIVTRLKSLAAPEADK